MDTGGIAKGFQPAPLLTPARTDAQAAGAVGTDLAPEAAVQQVGEAEAARFEPSDLARTRAAIDDAIRSMIEKNVTIDPKSREVVYQTLDERTGEVIRQIPDETLLRLRTYAREMREREAQAASQRVEKVA